MIPNETRFEMPDRCKQNYLNQVFQDLMDNLDFWDVEGNLEHVKK
jgi:hypothetical protein